MRTFALVALLLPGLALADAPFAEPLAATPLKKGELVPFDGVLDTEAAFIDTEKRLAGCTAKVQSYEKAPPVPLVLVVVAVVALVVGAGAGVGITYALKR